MSDHSWTVDNLASYLTGGLEAAERDRLEQHLAACPSCTEALAEAKTFDRALVSLFVAERPKPGLEDRMIRVLREKPEAAGSGDPRRARDPRRALRAFTLPMPVKFGLAAAGAVMLAVLGSVVEQNGLTGKNGLPAFWENRVAVISDESKSMEFGDIEEGGRASTRRLGTKLESADDLARSMREKSRTHWGLHDPRSVSQPRTDDGKDLSNDSDMLHLEAAPGNQPVGGMPGYGYGVAGGIGGGRTGWGSHGPFVGGGFAGNNFGGGFGGMSPGTPPGPGKLEPKITSGVFQPPPAVRTISPVPQEGDNEKPKEGQYAPTERDDVGKKPEPKPDPSAQPTPSEPDAPKGPAKEAPPEDVAPEKVLERKIIRTGDMEFEVESFEPAAERIVKIVGEEKGLVANMSSDKLPNGKTRGVLVVRVPPERLDTLILKLRALGELKRQKLGSEDVSKRFYDLEGRLKAARTMEKRLLKIIEEGKGMIKDLLEAEKQLGEWRSSIESLEGELRFYSNQIAMATLTIELVEKSISTAFALKETEKIDMGIEAEDVEKAYRAAQVAIAEAKGRILRSELKQPQPGQFNAVLQFEVTPEAAGNLRDRLNQLGKVARLDIDREQHAEGGTGILNPNVKVEHKTTNFFVSIYNLAKLTPRETTSLGLVAADVTAAYQNILNRVKKANGQIVQSSLDRQPANNSTATITFDVKTDDAAAVLTEVTSLGEEMGRQITEEKDERGVTDSKRRVIAKLVGFAHVLPRDGIELLLATRKVPEAFKEVKEAATTANAWIQVAQVNEQNQASVTAELQFDVTRDKQAAIDAVLARVGDVYSRKLSRPADLSNTIESRVRYAVYFTSDIRPREQITLGLKVSNVDKTADTMKGLIAERKGLVILQPIGREPSGLVTAKLTADVPLSAANELVAKFKELGTEVAFNVEPNPQVPASDHARAFIYLTVSNQVIVPTDEGPMAQLQSGIKNSFMGFAWSLKLIAIGAISLLPWLLVGYVIYRVVMSRRAQPEPPAAPPAPTA